MRGLLLVWAMGCMPADLEPDADGQAQGSGTTDAQGQAEVELRVGEGDRGFGLTATSNARVRVLALRDPQGGVVLEAEDDQPSHRLTQAMEPGSGDTTLVWPIRPEDPPLQAGIYTVLLQTEDGDNAPAPHTDFVLVSQARTWDGADQLSVRLAWTAEVAADPETQVAVREATQIWRGFYDALGLSLDVDEFAVSAPGGFELDTYGAHMQAAADAAGPGQLTVLVGTHFDFGPEYEGEALAAALSIPGPLVPTRRAGVLLATEAHADLDGGFSGDALLAMGQTLAHEAGHHLGLFHPAEPPWDVYDALEDTPECASSQGCLTVLSGNLMFPDNRCAEEGCNVDLTEDQRFVMTGHPLLE